jgi:hypothetical protein
VALGGVVLLDSSLHLVHFSILVNSTPIGLFSSTCGLRQGDHLSPLYALVMEALHRMIYVVVGGEGGEVV